MHFFLNQSEGISHHKNKSYRNCPSRKEGFGYDKPGHPRPLWYVRTHRSILARMRSSLVCKQLFGKQNFLKSR